MQSQIFNEGMLMLRKAYPQSNINFDDKFMMVWFEDLHDLNERAYLLAVRELKRNSKFFPSIAEIRETSRKHEGAGSGLKELPIATISPERQASNREKMAELIEKLGNKFKGGS